MEAAIATGQRAGLLAALLAASALASAPAFADGPPRTLGAPDILTRSDPTCSLYGPGYSRVPGSPSCVKVSGYVQTNAVTQSRSTSYPSATEPALRSR